LLVGGGLFLTYVSLTSGFIDRYVQRRLNKNAT
jgi:hypothetical protein